MVGNIGQNQRLAKNTLYLYLRTLLVMGTSIFTSRIILDILGVEDYGIYNVVGGFVSMFAVLSGTLTATSQRFIAYELGKKNSNVNSVFSTTVNIHFLLAVIIFILLETVGRWFLNEKMNIAENRVYAANWVFHCSVLTFCINLISIPYNAAIIAYERMSAFAYVSIFEVGLKLVLVYVLYLLAGDVLIVYSVFMLIVAVILRSIYGFYCACNFKECKYRLCFDKIQFKSILNLCGWNFIGSSANILNNQGINLLINLFFGVTLNAARGLATQVDGAINTFVQNFMMALNPQITKSYAAEDFIQVNKMVGFGTKIAFFLFWIIAFPVFVNIDFLLQLWLKQVPEYTAIFIRLGIIYTMCQNLSQCLYITMLANGNIKTYQIVVGGISLLAFPVTWLCFKFGFSCEWGYWSMIIFSIVCLWARLYILSGMVPLFSGISFLKKVLFPIMMSIIPPSILMYFIHDLFQADRFIVFFIETVVTVCLSIVSILLLGINKYERGLILQFFKPLLVKI